VEEIGHHEPPSHNRPPNLLTEKRCSPLAGLDLPGGALSIKPPQDFVHEKLVAGQCWRFCLHVRMTGLKPEAGTVSVHNRRPRVKITAERQRGGSVMVGHTLPRPRDQKMVQVSKNGRGGIEKGFALAQRPYGGGEVRVIDEPSGGGGPG